MLRASFVLAVGLSVLAGSACSHHPWVNPGWGWVTARTDHFVVHGDTSRRTIDQALDRFEETRAALASTFFRGTEIPLVEAVILEGSDYDQVVGERSVGVFVPGVGSTGSLLVVRD